LEFENHLLVTNTYQILFIVGASDDVIAVFGLD
jgi:hypothetical protein